MVPYFEKAREMTVGLPFPVAETMRPELLTLINPDYARFRQLSYIDPLVWGKRDISPSNDIHIVAFMGPSASGKDTILQDLAIPYSLIVTHTTREKRANSTVKEKHKYISADQFSNLKQHHAFIEIQKEISGLYGTTVAETEKALRSDAKIIVWRGEENGLPKLKKWFTKNHPEITTCVTFLLPQMPFIQLAARIIEQRNPDEASWRVQNAAKEIQKAGSVADFLILNPPQEGGPIDATRATENLFTYLSGSPSA